MTRLIACLLLLLSGSTGAFAEKLAQAAGPFAGKTTLVMVDDRNCGWCRKWDREVGVGYPKSKEGAFAPLTRLPRGDARLGPFRGIGYTPTFILVVNGEERGRIVGYPGADFFWAELERLVQRGAKIPDVRTLVPDGSRAVPARF
jgi:hypothetical protein